MKHLLIILSFLLLSSPVIGDSHKGETLYGWGYTLPYVWKGFGDKETNPKYEGDVENGVPISPILELPYILSTIRPSVCSLTMFFPLLEFPHILVSITKSEGSLSMVSPIFPFSYICFFR